MRKLLFLLLFAILCAKIEAQEERGTTYIELSPIFNLAKGAPTGIQMTLGSGKYLSERFYLGGGLGVLTTTKFKDYSIPVYARGKLLFYENDIMNIHARMDLGYNIPTKGGLDKGLIRIAPAVGVDYGNIYASIGYMRLEGVKKEIKGGDAITLSIGTYISSEGMHKVASGLGRFFARTHLTVEAGYGIGLTTTHLSDISTGYGPEDLSKKEGSNITVRLAWTYRINNQWSAGIGAGLDMQEYYDNFTYLGDRQYGFDDEKDSEEHVTAFARVKYNVLKTRFTPFIMCDLGYDIADASDNNGFVCEPTVGISLRTGEYQSLNLGLSYRTNTVGGSSGDSGSTTWNDQRDISTLNLRLGYTF